MRRKAFRTFSQVMREITPFTLLYIAILKKLVVLMVELFTFNWDGPRKKNIFAVWEALLKLSGSFGVQGLSFEV